jgi:hypothetical protein
MHPIVGHDVLPGHLPIRHSQRRRPVKGSKIAEPLPAQLRPGVAQFDAVAAGLVHIKEEGLLDGVLARARLDEHAVVEGDVGGADDVGAGVGRKRDVMQPPGRSGPAAAQSPSGVQHGSLSPVLFGQFVR